LNRKIETKGGHRSMAKKAATTAPEATDESEAQEEEGPRGMTTREVAEMLGTTPQKLRRVLRSEEFQNDKAYTRYALTDEDVEKLRAALAAGAGSRKTKKSAEEGEADEAPAELDALEEGDDEEEADELDLDEDEEE
jgi:ABC-type phosphate/phosphonate transport system substrate-binding protein